MNTLLKDLMRRLTRRTLPVLLGVLGMLIVGGCSSSPGGSAPTPTDVRSELPSYSQLAEAHNQRVARLDRLWSRMSFVVRRPDPEKPGKTLSDQAEGHIQIEQPNNVSVSMTKLGELFFLLGSNDDLYWWIDRTSKREPVVLFGRHELAGPKTLEWLGVSLAPLELVDLFGITPLPVATEQYEVWVLREAEGQVSVIVPTRFGYRKLIFAEQTHVLEHVELLDAAGDLVVRSELGRSRRVPVRGEGEPGEFMGTRIRLEIPAEDVFISIELAEQTNKDLNPAAFDFQKLLRGYGRNGKLYDLDAQIDEQFEEPGIEPETLGRGNAR